MRGVANLDLTPEVVLAFGRAAARVLGGTRFVVGRDTRRSGPLLEAALVAGLAAEGVDVTTLGVVPTPAVAWLAAAEGAAGAVISASHNPFADNGVKLFTADGKKLSDEVEERAGGGAARAARRPRSRGRRERARPSARSSTARPPWIGGPNRWPAPSRAAGLAGLTVVVDCANGAASAVAPRVLRSLGATVEVIHDQPDGTNINAGCGSTYPDDLRRAVVDARRRRRARLRRRRRSGAGHRCHGPADRRRSDHRRSAPSTATPTVAWPRTPSSSP